MLDKSMRARLSLKSYILIAPATVLALIVLLLLFVGSQVRAIRAQNETIHALATAIDHVESALAAAQQMQTLAAASAPASGDTQFSYFEQSTRFSEHALSDELLALVPPASAARLRADEEQIRYREPFVAAQVRAPLAAAVPHLHSLQTDLWAQKRAAFLPYYINTRELTARMAWVSLSTLAFALIVGALLSAWTVRRISRRVQELSRELQTGATPAAATRDELDVLAQRIAQMNAQAQDRLATEHLLAGAEEERRRIAMDMHDQTLSELTHIARELHALDREDTGENRRARLAQLQGAIHETIRNLRAIMDDLYPQTLDTLGLAAALRSHLERQSLGANGNAPRFTLAVDAHADARLTPAQRLDIYRIAVEATHNCLRHARCTQYEIDCRAVGGELHLSIEDDGVGFDAQAVQRGHGLNNILQRARRLGAHIEWTRSRFASGNRLALRLALPHTASRPHALSA